MASSYQCPASGSSSSSVVEQQQGKYSGHSSSQGGNGQSDAEMFASSSEPSPPRSHLDGGGPLGSQYKSPMQFQNAMDLVQRLEAQLKTVRLDKDRLKERCFLLEREVNDNLRHHYPSSTSYASPLPMLATAPPSTTTAHKGGPQKHHRHHNYHLLEEALAEERATRSGLQARLAKSEAQLKSRDKEVHSLQKRLHLSNAAIRETETKFLSDLSRLFMSVHPEEDVGERAMWERELGLALAEVRRLKEELAGLSSSRARKEEQQEDSGTGIMATTSMPTRPLRGEKRTTSEKSRRREQEKGWARLQEKVLRQAERIRADKKLVRLLKKEIGRVQEEEEERIEELLASREAQKGRRVELAASAQRHKEDLEYEQRKEVEATRAIQALGKVREEEGEREGLGEGWVLVNVEREGEEALRRRCKKEKNEKGKKAGQKQEEEEGLCHHRRHHHHHRYDRNEEEEENQRDAPDQVHSRRHRHHHQQCDERQQQQQSPSQVRRKSRTKGGKIRTPAWSTPPRSKPQAWEINFPPGKKEYEVSPLIHRFETYET